MQPDPASLRLAEQRWRQRAAAQRAAAERGEDAGPRSCGDAGAPFALGIALSTPFHGDASFDAFDDDDVGLGLGAWLAYDVLALGGATFLALELDYGNQHEDSDALLGARRERARHACALRRTPAALRAASVFQPHLRLAGGAAYSAMQLRTSSPEQRFEDSGFAPFGSLGLGFTVRTPTRMFETRGGDLASLSLGLMVEAGYTLTAPLALSLQDDEADAGEIALTDAELGELQRSGPYLRFSLVTRF